MEGGLSDAAKEDGLDAVLPGHLPNNPLIHVKIHMPHFLVLPGVPHAHGALEVTEGGGFDIKLMDAVIHGMLFHSTHLLS